MKGTIFLNKDGWLIRRVQFLHEMWEEFVFEVIEGLYVIVLQLQSLWTKSTIQYFYPQINTICKLAMTVAQLVAKMQSGV